MAMRKAQPAVNPDAYVAMLSGWRRGLVEQLRDAARAPARIVETIKWGHLVYVLGGPVCLVRAEDARVLFGFWRGRQLRGIEPRLKPGGKYDMATLELREGDTLSAATARKLMAEAVRLNRALGDPTAVAAAWGQGT